MKVQTESPGRKLWWWWEFCGYSFNQFSCHKKEEAQTEAGLGEEVFHGPFLHSREILRYGMDIGWTHPRGTRFELWKFKGSLWFVCWTGRESWHCWQGVARSHCRADMGRALGIEEGVWSKVPFPDSHAECSESLLIALFQHSKCGGWDRQLLQSARSESRLEGLGISWPFDIVLHPILHHPPT